MTIPPDPYPSEQSGLYYYAGQTAFGEGANVRQCEIRGEHGTSVVSLSISVVPPPGAPSVHIQGITVGVVNYTQPQIAVEIIGLGGGDIADGYICQFAFATTDG